MAHPPFSIYEAALLLKTTMDVKLNLLDREIAETKLSTALRLIGAKSGVELDDTYRNPTGMHFMMMDMEYALSPDTAKYKRNPSKVIYQVVDLFYKGKPFVEVYNKACETVGWPTENEELFTALQGLVEGEQLLRDCVPEIFKEAGITLDTYVVDDPDYLNSLETLLDYSVRAYHFHPEIEKLADMLEVIYGIAQAKGYKFEDLLECRYQRALKLGCYDEKIALSHSKDR